MKLNVWAFGVAIGIVIAAAFTICAFFVAVTPEATADFIGYILHINLSGLTRPISWGSYFAGSSGDRYMDGFIGCSRRPLLQSFDFEVKTGGYVQAWYQERSK